MTSSNDRQRPNPRRTNDRSEMDVPDEIPGGFRVGQEIGRGSFAVVYEGFHPSSQQKVAIKAVIKSKLTNKLFQNLQDEIKILKQIRHGNVVGLVDCISTNHHIYLIMQYCSQGDLSVYIKATHLANKNRNQSAQPPSTQPDPSALLPSPNQQRRAETNTIDRFPHPPDGGLNEWIVRSFLGQLADALHFLRSHSIIHRDIKPQNLLLHPSSPPSSDWNTNPPPGIILPPNGNAALSPNNQPMQLTSVQGRQRYVPEGIPILRVADFGFARVLTPSAGLAETLCGSPLYMAPEILRYEKYDAKADLWSVGAVLYEMSVGKPPFRAQNHMELLKKIERSEDKIVFPEDKPVSADIKQLIQALLKRNPSERVNFSEFFRMAHEVSNCGLLIPPAGDVRDKQQRPSNFPRKSSSSISPVSTQNNKRNGHQESLPFRPPSTSTLPPPPSPKARIKIATVPSLFEGEPGAFIVDKSTGLSRQTSYHTAATSPASASHPSGTTEPAKPPACYPPPNNQPSDLSHHHLSQQAPSPSLLPAPLPTNTSQRQLNVMPSFPAKYVIAGPSSSHRGTVTTTTTSTHQPMATTGIKTKDYALMPSSTKGNPSIKDSTGMVLLKNDDDDRDLGTEYVVVEKGSVEINALVDALSPSPGRAMSLTRRMSRGFMSSARPTLAALSSSPHHPSINSSPPPSSLITTGQHSTSISSFPPRPHPLPSPPSTGIHPMMITNFGRSSPSMTHHHPNYPSSPRSFDSSGGGGGGGIVGSLPIVGKYFPHSYLNHGGSSPGSVAPHSANSSGGGGVVQQTAGALSNKNSNRFMFPSSRICRAILSSNPTTNQSSRQTGYGTAATNTNTNNWRNTNLDPVESNLMNDLEEFACKILVILQFADEKLCKILPPTPSSTLQSNFIDKPGSTMNYTLGGAFVSSSFNQSQNNSSSRMTNSEELQNVNGQDKILIASEATVLYIKALAFLDRAIRHAVEVVNWKKQTGNGGGNLNGYSPEVGYAIEWMRNKFNEVFDKAEFVKARSNDTSLSSGIYAEKMIYDRALEKSRSAAVNELMGDHLNESEIDYEISLYMLHCLLDPIMKTKDVEISTSLEDIERKKEDDGESLEEAETDEVVEDQLKLVILKFIQSIQVRLTALRKKILVNS